MVNLIKLILFSGLMLANDGEGPLLTNIIPISDFFNGDPIQIEIQAIDKDGIGEILLYYRFNTHESYQNIKMEQEINYSAIIPGFEVISNKIEYYFLATDIFGNQRKYPEEGADNPIKFSILKENNNQMTDYEINLIEPQNNSQTKNISIIILSIYGENEDVLKNNVEIILNNQNITNDCNITNDLITYVPSKRLDEGSYELIFKMNNKTNPILKKFYFESLQLIKKNNQDNTYSWIEKINYSGNLDYSSDYDKFNYENNTEEQNRPLDIHRFNFNFKAKHQSYTLKSSILFNTHIIDGDARLNKKDKQPIDRIKIGLNSPYGTLNFGDYSTTFTDLTLKGTRVRGFHSSIQIGLLKLTYVRGKTKELIQSYHYYDPEGVNNPDLPGIYLDNGGFEYYEKGTPSRNLRALRTEFNFGKKIIFGLTGLTSYDVEDVDIPYLDLYENYLFMGNALIGSDLTLFLNNKKTWLSMETAISITNDILDENINNYEEFNLNQQQRDLVGALENLVGFSITTDLLLGRDQGRGLSIPNPPVDDNFNIAIDSDYLKNIIPKGTYKIKFRSPFSLFKIPCNINGEYKRIPFSFVSFGNPSIPKDIQGLSTVLKMIFFNNQMMINLGYNNDNDNVNDYKLSTTSSSGNNIGINLNFDKLPSINYSRKILIRNDDGGLINNQTITHSINRSDKVILEKFNIRLNNNLVIMNYRDLLTNANDNNFQQISFSKSISLSAKKFSINSGIGFSKNKPKDTSNKSETEFLAFSSKISYKLQNNKLSSYVGFNRTTGESDDIDNALNNQKDSFKIGAQYKLNQYSNIKYNVEYLIFSDKINNDNNYSELKGKLTFQISF